MLGWCYVTDQVITVRMCVLCVPSNWFKMADSSWQDWLRWTLMHTRTDTNMHNLGLIAKRNCVATSTTHSLIDLVWYRAFGADVTENTLQITNAVRTISHQFVRTARLQYPLWISICERHKKHGHTFRKSDLENDIRSSVWSIHIWGCGLKAPWLLRFLALCLVGN